MRPIIFKEPGKIVLVPYNADGTLSFTSDKVVTNVGKLVSIAPSVTINTSTLTDGNSDWQMVFDTGRTGQITVTMATFQPKLYAALMGTSVVESASATMWAADEGYTIPTVAPYEVTLAHTPTTDGTLIVVGEDGTTFTKVATAPAAAGEFSITGNKLTFYSGDAGKAIYVTYEWSATSATTFGLPERGSRPALYVVISGLVYSDDEAAVYDTNIIIDKCKASGDIAQPTMQKEPQNWNFTLQVLQPRPGNKAVDYKFALRA
ncbi:MAG: hypothetical protein ACPLTR_02915 [Thermacetogeniaceae bacterium]